MTVNLLHSFEFGVEFYPYQKEALACLTAKFQQGQKDLHLVAPPGAGKTLLGLELIRRFGLRAVILSPNTTIQTQWVQKFRQLTVDLSGLEGLYLQEVISTDWENQPEILSLTYQAFSVQGTQDVFHPNVLKLFAELKSEGYHLLVLDECHHLLAHWGKAVQYYQALNPDLHLLGLTATPPVDRRENELALYLSLVGEVDYLIPTPAVIREGHLAPFQDLAYLVRPTPLEGQYIAQAHEALHRLLQILENPSSNLPCLSVWAETWLLEPSDLRGRPIAKERLLEREPDLCIALMRYLYSRSIYPIGMPWSPEMETELEMLDLVRILQAYGSLILEKRGSPLWNDLISALEPLGYQYRKGLFYPGQGQVDKVLSLSSAKLRAVETILKHEMAQMGEGLKALVITDFEKTHVGGLAAAHILDPEAGGAMAVMRYLTADPELDALDPLLVTGSTLLCDDDLWPVFQVEARQYFAEHGWEIVLSAEPAEGFFSIQGQGRDWKSSVYLALVTHLLEVGITRCLIGTRGLLGEGWDCPGLNTLLDLTAVSTYVSVNQIRGRSLRQIPEHGIKIANNWDIIALMPELEGGFSDLQRFYRKHEHFYGLSDDGCLEKGAGHVHAAFVRLERHELLREMENINQDMLRRAAQRGLVYDQWRVGQKYDNRDLACLQLHGSPPSDQNLPNQTGLRTPISRQENLALQTLFLNQKTLHWRLNFLRFWVFPLAVASYWGALNLSALFWLICAGLWSLATESWGSWVAKQHNTYLEKLINSEQGLGFISALSQALLDALQAVGELPADLGPEAIRLSQRSGQTLRVILQTENPQAAQIFSQALSECFQPLQEQRYVLRLESPQFALEKQIWGQNLISLPPEILWLPVPRILGSSRSRADRFQTALTQTVGPSELIYTKQGQGRELIQTHFRKRSLGMRASQVAIWE